MYKDYFHIHGDNIVECERTFNYILTGIESPQVTYDFESPACPKATVIFEHNNQRHCFEFVLYPGFNKSTMSRWSQDIYQSIKDSGGFLDETPDAVISRVAERGEEILLAVEFCSALQAGNQAWQRSGRALSTARSGCPYLYIVDFVKYELDSTTRSRKNLRFPNPAVAYSYVNYSLDSENYAVQVYVEAEEFQPQLDKKLAKFDCEHFGDKELSAYILNKLLKLDTSQIERELLRKNYGVVHYLAELNSDDEAFSVSDWDEIYQSGSDVIEYAIINGDFSCSKKIANKSVSSNTVLEFRDLVGKQSHGIGSKDLPIGVIPKSKVKDFLNEVKRIYPDEKTLDKIDINSDLVISLIKGFKPRGDDNRPDRGLLPLVSMLSSEERNVLTFLYGPILNRNFELLLNEPAELAKRNGLWRSILSLSDYLILDCPLLHGTSDTVQMVLDNRSNKRAMLEYNKNPTLLSESVSPNPVSYSEDDVDTALHMLLSRAFGEQGYECMCNPPGGDWSGFSVIKDNLEMRWLSLPRVSNDGKRPDHITEIVGVFDKPLLLITESKGSAADLEPNVGLALIRYVKWLMGFTPSAERVFGNEKWALSSNSVSERDFDFLSAGAFLNNPRNDIGSIFKMSACDLLFELKPNIESNDWTIIVYASSPKAEVIARFLTESCQDLPGFRVEQRSVNN